jgi:hypothetical protein
MEGIMADEMTTRDAAMKDAWKSARKAQAVPCDPDACCPECERWDEGFYAGWNARTTDLARLLEAMRRDAVDAEDTAAVLRIRVRTGGSGYVMLDGGAPTHFDTIEAGVAQLKAIIDDAEEGE